ncbi:MAG TPA: hypothetical protein QF703_00350 [Candidatus Thalassarchaeaceae archaeon]|nr:hypothetical protein [Candidatus Thalassarchaeaceae archaeon]|tara:strand:+ start:2475 stop:3134 length:660 start_codon:yes stop_codon:yes gene_type:complete
MSVHTDHLDSFLSEQPAGVHNSHRKLASIVREAYPIGVPALIMKSSTDRFGASAGYSFHLGTPDEFLRRIASWLITKAGDDQGALLKLVGSLWKRHGREDVALAALLLANTDMRRLGVDPWDFLAGLLHRKEPLEALLLSVEELFRAGCSPPSEEVIENWCGGRLVESHLALLVVYVGNSRGSMEIDNLRLILSGVEIADGDSLIRRVKAKLMQKHPEG